MIKRVLIDDLSTRHVDEVGARLHPTELRLANPADRLRTGRHRHDDVIGALQHPVENLWAAEQRQIVLHRLANVPPDCANLLFEGTSTASDVLTDPPKAKNADRPAGELRPKRRRRRADRPVALPIAPSQRRVRRSANRAVSHAANGAVIAAVKRP